MQAAEAGRGLLGGGGARPQSISLSASGLLALLTAVFSWAGESVHTVPYVPSASSAGHAGVVRIESRSEVPGEVRVVAVDDAGRRVEAGVLPLGARAAVEFDAAALESGDAPLGLNGTGPGEGDWRLDLTTELDIEARAYARTDGFATALHDARLVSGGEIELPFFNPGSETEQRSILRLANAGDGPATVTVRGVDDAGASAGPVTVELGAGEARSYAAEELEGGSAPGLAGSLGDGEGNWRLRLSAEAGSAYATNLLLDVSGVLASVPDGMSRGGFHRVSLFPSASDGDDHRGLVRVVNRAAETAEVAIEAFDETDRAYERLKLMLGAESSSQFDSTALEQGGEEKGLDGSTGAGEGDWWLELSSAMEIEVLSYVDTASGPLSALRGTSGSEMERTMRYEALLRGESGELRLLNAGDELVDVRVTGVDDSGTAGGEAALTLEPWTARRLTVSALEEGREGLRGALGSGAGNWRLVLETDGELDVLSLVRGSGGMLSDVSRRGLPAGAPPRTELIDASAQRRADLWVSASVSASELPPGEAFELRATVGNRGAAESRATTLRYYRSPDAAITPSDTELGTDAVAVLAPDVSASGSISLNAPEATGTQYYGACADTVANESSTSNNCSGGVRVVVSERARDVPDLVVSASTDKSNPEPEESFTLSATVRNRGSGGAGATTLRYYSSPNSTITTEDSQAGTDRVRALSASGTSAKSIDLTARLSEGPYFYGACVDAVEGELDPSNNCSPGVLVTAERVPPPDLGVSSVVPARETHWVGMGESTTVAATVTNGGKVSDATTLSYYLTRDDSPAPAAVTVQVPPLDRSGTFSHRQAGVPVPETPGEYFQRACVDVVPGEVRTLNNCDTKRAFDVAVPQPIDDFDVTIPLGCPLEVEMCVQDHECEDGDRARISVNGSELFTTDLFVDRWVCETAAVSEGENLFEAYTVNGSGHKGMCSYENVNTGAIEVRVVYRTVASMHWRLPAHYLSSSSLNVTVVDLGPWLGCPLSG